MTQSRKQARRQAAKARRRHYVAMREAMLDPERSLFDHLCARVAYERRVSLIAPLYAERPQWEPPPGRRDGMSTETAVAYAKRAVS